MYRIGEALIGKGNEVAHIELIIGKKDGKVGDAFVKGFTNASIGHVPLLSVIRPNLMTKPATLIIPKVTIRDMDDANKIFGPAQMAVGRAIADAVEEGIIPKEKVEELVVIVSVFVHPDAKDYRKIYQYNYGATKLALRRAIEGYPPIDKILSEKDRSVHPIMGFKVPKLWNPPYIQVALDMDDLNEMKRVINELPKRERLILEAGTPLIKKYGVHVVNEIRKLRKDAFIVADLKTLDVGRLEVKMASDETADAVAISGLASIESIEKAIHETQRQGVYSILDMMNVSDIEGKLKKLRYKPDIVLLHRSVDVETVKAERGEKIGEVTEWGNIKRIKSITNALVAVAGGITPDNVQKAIKSGADIIVVGRYITGSKDVRRASQEFLDQLPPDPDTMRLPLDEDESI